MGLVVCEFPELVDTLAVTAELGNGELHLHIGYDLGTRLKKSSIPFGPIFAVRRTVIKSEGLANPAVVPSGCVFRCRPFDFRQACQERPTEIVHAALLSNAENLIDVRNVLPVDRITKAL